MICWRRADGAGEGVLEGRKVFVNILNTFAWGQFQFRQYVQLLGASALFNSCHAAIQI